MHVPSGISVHGECIQHVCLEFLNPQHFRYRYLWLVWGACKLLSGGRLQHLTSCDICRMVLYDLSSDELFAGGIFQNRIEQMCFFHIFNPANWLIFLVTYLRATLDPFNATIRVVFPEVSQAILKLTGTRGLDIEWRSKPNDHLNALWYVPAHAFLLGTAVLIRNFKYLYQRPGAGVTSWQPHIHFEFSTHTFVDFFFHWSSSLFWLCRVWFIGYRWRNIVIIGSWWKCKKI